MTTKSFSTTSSALIIERMPSRITVASRGAISISDLSDARAFYKERPSRNAQKRNKKVTAADSTYSPIMSAPITAMVTKSSILNIFCREACHALKTVGTPATIEAVINSASNTVWFPLKRYTANAARSKAPAAYINLFTCCDFIVLSSVFYGYYDKTGKPTFSMTSTNRSADTFSSSKSTFTLLELKSTLALSTPGSFFSTPSIRVIQLGQVSVSNWNLFVFNVFEVFILYCFIRY